MDPHPERASRRVLREHFEHDREIHVYGLGDLTEPYWSRSRWWHAGSATIGEIGLTDDPTDRIVYGINAGVPVDALRLWGAIDHDLPDRYFATGVVGFADHLTQRGRIVEYSAGEQVKMVLRNLSPDRRPDATSARPIDQRDLGAIEKLRATGTDPGSFFHPGLLDDGHFRGLFDGDALIAMAGVHVCSQDMDVAAVGCVLVHPEYRGTGLGAVVTSAVCRSLLDLGIGTIGLNVGAKNAAARVTYQRLGFTEVHRYEEALVARPPRHNAAEDFTVS